MSIGIPIGIIFSLIDRVKGLNNIMKKLIFFNWFDASLYKFYTGRRYFWLHPITWLVYVTNIIFTI